MIPHYLTPEQVCKRVPGMTAKKLENRRGAGLPPRYFKPTPKTVLYLESDIVDWIAQSAVEPSR